MKSASITTTIIGNGPKRWIHADVTIRPGIPQFAIRGVCKATAIEMRRLVIGALIKRGYSIPFCSITADMDFAVPFEGIAEISFALAAAILAASGQIDVQQLAGIAISENNEEVHLSAA